MAIEVKTTGEGGNKPHGVVVEGCTTTSKMVGVGVEGKKELLRQIPRVKLWFVLALTGTFTVVLLATAHITHSLTLRVEAYHALYNLLSLIGCLLTMKLCSRPESLHNTFGWARLEVLSMLTTLLFLLALCFSVVIESVQTAVHAEHQDAMHHPLSVMTLGGVGLCLNALVFVLIGGYTHHQGCFLEMRDSGSVWVGRQVTQEAVQAGRRMLSSNDLRAGGLPRPPRTIQLVREVLRDALGLVMVIVCAAVVHWDDGGTVALYIDPALAVTSSALLVWFSYPYGKECGQILLQTIPGHIDVENFQTRVLEQFPAILNIHHLHIWSFTPTKVVATAHMVFSNPRVYLATQPALRQFFMDEGITKVTIQPECLTAQSGCLKDSSVCLLRCQHEGCHARGCCPSSHLALLTSVTSTHPTTTRRRGSKESGTNGEEDTERAKPGVSGRHEAEELVNGGKAAARDESKICQKTEISTTTSDEKSTGESLISESSRTETEILTSNPMDMDGERKSYCIPEHRELYRDENEEWTGALEKVTEDSRFIQTREGGGEEALTNMTPADSVARQHHHNTNATTPYTTNTNHYDIRNTTQHQYTNQQGPSNTSEGDQTNHQHGSMNKTIQQQQQHNNTSASYNRDRQGNETDPLQTEDNKTSTSQLEGAALNETTQPPPPRPPLYSDEGVNEATELLLLQQQLRGKTVNEEASQPLPPSDNIVNEVEPLIYKE